MAFPERHTANILLTTLFLALLGGLIYTARRVILLFILAMLFAYLLDPLVKFLQRHSLFFKNLRGPAVVEVYFACLLVIALFAYTVGPAVSRNTGKLIDEIPVLLNGLSTGDIATEVGDKYGWTAVQEFRFKSFLGRHSSDVQTIVRNADRVLSSVVQLLGWLALVPVLAIFFLRDGDHIADALIQLVFPASWYQSARNAADELHLMLTRYIRAQVFLCGLSFAFYATTALVLRFPHAIALAVMGGLLEFIPVIGWTSTAATIIVIGVLTHSQWVLMITLLGVWRVIQNYFNAPRLLGRQLEIHPLAAIFAVFVGAEVGGIVGMYLAVPLMAGMRVIWRLRMLSNSQTRSLTIESE